MMNGRPLRRVDWLNARLIEQRRAFGLGKKVITEFVSGENGSPSHTSIPESEIGNLKDPQLRCALRLQAAINAAGPIVESSEDVCGSSSFRVVVEATEEGLDSRLAGATYSGIVTKTSDSFMDYLYAAGQEQK